ncbi:MAG: hypothetical protein ACIAQF_08280 [Phycisphaerales bacterium JB065]
MSSITVNATTRRFVNEQIRPIANLARSIYIAGLAMNTIIDTHLSELIDANEITIDAQTGEVSAANPTKIIDDGRAAEGDIQITTGQLALLLNLHRSFVAQVADSTDLQAAVERACLNRTLQS